jgi:hypothetical protein
MIQQLIVRLALSKGGPLVINLISALAAFLSVKAAKLLPGSEAIFTPEIIAALVFLIVNEVLSYLPSKVLKDYGKQVQTLLNEAGASLKVDGVVLVKTAEAVKQVTQK